MLVTTALDAYAGKVCYVVVSGLRSVCLEVRAVLRVPTVVRRVHW